MLRDNKTSETRLTYQSNESITYNDAVNGLKRLEIWQAIWDGVVSPHNAVTSIIETAAVALNLLSMPETTMEVSRNQARELWAKRRK